MAADDTTATFSCPIRGSDTGDYDIIKQWAITAPVHYEAPILLASGNNAISPGINGVTFQLLIIITPEAGLIDQWHLKGVNGDTGVYIASPTVVILGGINLTPGLVLEAAAGGYTIITRWLR